MNEIAIASVPIQEWEETYDVQQALREGTIFPQLKKPFFVEDEMKQREVMPLTDCESQLLEIQQVTFFLTDLTLYLDTHPEDTGASDRRKELQQKRKELMAQFAMDYYPLSMQCEGEQVKEPVPWEREDIYVAL